MLSRVQFELLICIIILFIILSIIIFYNYTLNNQNLQDNNIQKDIEIHYSKKYPIKIKKCFSNVLKPELNLIKKYKLNLVNKCDNTCDLIIPCGYNNIDKKINEIDILNNKQKIYVIFNCDKIVSKNNLWNILFDKYGNTNEQIMPKTYIINNKKDIELFKNKYYKNNNNLFLLKKNIQRKEGILLSKNIDNILVEMNNGYKIIQEYIPNLYLINKRKINLRYYFLIINKEGIINTFLYKYGKCIYSNKDYDIDYKKIPESELMDYKEVFLTSYNLDPEIYNINPEDFNELENYMGEVEYNILYNRIINTFYKLSKAIQYKFSEKSKLYNNLCFQLFGADIIFDKDLKPYLLELNKGPSMKYVTNKDKLLKEKLIEDLFFKMKLLNTKNHNEKIDEKKDFNYIKIL